MKIGLDIPLAVREANRVFRRYPVRFCLPMVMLGLATYSLTAAERGRSLWFVTFLLLVTLCVQWFIEVFLSTMYLRSREGGEPNGKQAGEVLRYSGFGRLIVELFFRCLGWILVVCVIAFVCFVVFFASQHLAGRPQTHVMRDPLTRGIWTIVFEIVSSCVLYRYIFVLPMFALSRGSRRGFIKECVALTKPVRISAIVLALASMLPHVAHATLKLVVWGRISQPIGVARLGDASLQIGVECFAAWFILLTTGLALQLTGKRDEANAG